MPTEGRYERAHRELEAARQARNLVQRLCPHCGVLMGEFRPPIGLYYSKCRRCGIYSELTTMEETPQQD